MPAYKPTTASTNIPFPQQYNHIFTSNQTLYATIHLKGRPFTITNHDILIAPHHKKLKVEDKVTLNNVKEIGNNTYAIRAPLNQYINDKWTNIQAHVIAHVRAKKQTTVKFKRRKNYKRTIGRREMYTVFKIAKVQFGESNEMKTVESVKTMEIPEYLGEDAAARGE